MLPVGRIALSRRVQMAFLEPGLLNQLAYNEEMRLKF